MISYNADSHTLYGALSFLPAGVHPAGTKRPVYDWDSGNYLGEIDEVPATFAVVGNMNERQLAIAETTFTGRPELVDPTGGIDYGSLMFIALQRAANAREAIAVMTDLVARHGYASSGESFSIADPDQVWILEMIGKGPGSRGAVWVACRIPDGEVSAHANQARIRQFPLGKSDECVFSPDVISFARDKGYFSGQDREFSFADAYGPPTWRILRACEARVWNIFRKVAPSLKISADFVKGIDGAAPMPLSIRPDRRLTVQDVQALMRDHFEGTEFDLSTGLGAGPYGLPYRWRPMEWTVEGEKHINERSVATQQTGFSFVSQARGTRLPDPVAGVLWFAVDDAATSVYVPIYCGITEVPSNYAERVATLTTFSWDSAFWVFNFVANFTYSRWSEMIVDVRRAQSELEGALFSRQAGVEAAAAKLYQTSPDLARDYLTQYCAEQAAGVHQRWRRLLEELLVKYMDGNLKDEHGQVLHPGYPNEWNALVAKVEGERYKSGKLKGEKPPTRVVSGSGFFHTRDELGPLAPEVPPDFPFDTEKLFLLSRADRCGRPPLCCLSPQAPASQDPLLLALPEPVPGDKCGPRDYLVRIPRDEKRSVVIEGTEE
jgi:dipeptidase